MSILYLSNLIISSIASITVCAVDLRSGEVVYLYMDLGQLTEEMINLVANNFKEFIQNLAETND